ncbi:MAG TPA: hypothetical protein VIL33_01970 [Rhodothermia bacterium]
MVIWCLLNNEKGIGNVKSGQLLMMRKCGFLMLLAALASCDSSEEDTGPYDCTRGGVPAGAQCFEFQGEQQAFRFDEPGVVGSWSSNEFETCIEYAADGTGRFRYWGIIGSVPRDDSSILWGVWVDDDGEPIVGGDGRPVVVNHLEEGPVLDRRLVGLGYSETTGFGGDFQDVTTCPQNSESNQGAITFFTTNTTTDAVTIALNSFVIGELTATVGSNEPECGNETSASTLTVYRQPGTYRFQALSSTATWGPLNIPVAKGDCSSHALR